MAGRPTDYREEYCEQVVKLCKLGATDKEIADFFDVDESTINNWKIAHSEFFESIKKGKIVADAEIADSLYHRAKGYQHPDVDIKVIEGKIVMTPLVKHYPPDTVAGIFWLKNRRGKVKQEEGQRWADKQEVTGEGGGPLTGPPIVINAPNGLNLNLPDNTEDPNELTDGEGHSTV
jgi:hypothetical protein